MHREDQNMNSGIIQDLNMDTQSFDMVDTAPLNNGFLANFSSNSNSPESVGSNYGFNTDYPVTTLGMDLSQHTMQPHHLHDMTSNKQMDQSLSTGMVDMSLYKSPQPERPFSGYQFPPTTQPNNVRLPMKRHFEYDVYDDRTKIDRYQMASRANLSHASTPHLTPPPPQGQCQLPPCRVCGEKASGFHYGANTCEACKVNIT